MTTPIPFGDLRRDVLDHRDQVDERIGAVFERGVFILGPELTAFEHEFADWLGIRRVIGVSSGTDAIALALTALGIRPADEVVTVANTAAPTALAIAMTGARVRLVDCDPETLMISIPGLEAAMTVRTRAIVPVHLYGSAADMRAILRIAAGSDVVVVEDCAHAVGTRLADGPAGTFGHAAAFSFYPTKNLGAYGDAGAVATNDDEVADRTAALRHQGQRHRDVSDERGRNARLDEIQAAVLRAKLPSVSERNRRRRAIADHYAERFADAGIQMPKRPPYVAEHAYHLFPVLVPDREGFRRRLGERGIETLVHYPVPLHMQPALSDLGYRLGDFPVAERTCAEIVSIPLYPQMTDGEVERVAGEVIAAI